MTTETKTRKQVREDLVKRMQMNTNLLNKHLEDSKLVGLEVNVKFSTKGKFELEII